MLVDEALVPLVLAGTTHRETPRLEIIKLVGDLSAERDYDTDSDSRNVHLTEAGARKVEKALGGIDLYSEEHVGTTLDRGQCRAARARAAAARRALHRPRRCRAPDQRLTRPHRAAAALAGRPAGCRRGQGGHRDHRDRRGARHHHGAGADQPIHNRVRHDRHRTGRRRAAAPVLQARRLTDTAEHPQHSRGRVRPGLHHRRRQERRHRRPHRRGARDRAAGAGRHPRRRRIRGAARAACCAAAFPRWCSTPRTTPRRRR